MSSRAQRGICFSVGSIFLLLTPKPECAMQLTLAEVAAMMEAASFPDPPHGETRISGYSIDSRTVQPRELFFAVRGQRLDGHDFVAAALGSGAAAAVVAASKKEACPAALHSRLLAVPDPLAAMQVLASAVRQKWGGPVVAVTGSSGKTTTKQMIAALLGTKFRVLENHGNLNNHFGLPLSLLRLNSETEIGVFEMGMSAVGEIALLAQ